MFSLLKTFVSTALASALTQEYGPLICPADEHVPGRAAATRLGAFEPVGQGNRGKPHNEAAVLASTSIGFDQVSLKALPGGSMKIRDRETIPAFLSIDVEPDAFQISGDGTAHWSGYRATHEFAVLLRRQLAQASGAKPIFGWYYRMDPQIEQVCGRADIAMTAFPDRAAALREEGDYFGVHTHPIRWSNDRRLWVHDWSDRQWLRDCTKFSLDAFSACNGSPSISTGRSTPT